MAVNSKDIEISHIISIWSQFHTLFAIMRIEVVTLQMLDCLWLWEFAITLPDVLQVTGYPQAPQIDDQARIAHGIHIEVGENGRVTVFAHRVVFVDNTIMFAHRGNCASLDSRREHRHDANRIVDQILPCKENSKSAKRFVHSHTPQSIHRNRIVTSVIRFLLCGQVAGSGATRANDLRVDRTVSLSGANRSAGLILSIDVGCSGFGLRTMAVTTPHYAHLRRISRGKFRLGRARFSVRVVGRVVAFGASAQVTLTRRWILAPSKPALRQQVVQVHADQQVSDQRQESQTAAFDPELAAAAGARMAIFPRLLLLGRTRLASA